MDLSESVAVIDESGAALTAACRVDPSARVPTCPDWDLAGLASHIGAVHGWVTANLRGDGKGAAPFEPCPPGRDTADWADEQRATMLTAFDETDPDRLVWGFAPDVPARMWWRRQTHETTVHAWDATNTVGPAWTIPSDIAVDGVDEMLTLFVPRRWARAAPEWGAGKSIHLHRTDGDGEWLLQIDASATLTRGHAKGDLAVQGTGTDLLLWLNNRTANVSLFGDTALADAWAANFAF
jgi:uncharacterized protein (TIGR03083 family)